MRLIVRDGQFTNMFCSQSAVIDYKLIWFYQGPSKPKQYKCPQAGQQCWVCNGAASTWSDRLTPEETFAEGPRYGSYLRAIPPQNRIGDYVHCNSRVINIFFKRLLAEFDEPRKAGPLKTILGQLTLQAQGQAPVKRCIIVL